MEKIFLAADIARTHLVTKKKQTLVASLGVTFGIAMFILMISFMTGVNELLEETMLTSSPHIHIYHDVETNRPSIVDELNPGKDKWNLVWHMKPKNELLKLKNGFIIAERIRRDPGILGVSPQLTSQVFYNNGPTQIGGSIVGVNIIEENKLYQIDQKMQSGTMEGLLTGNDVILMGSGLAAKLNVHVGDKITITTPQGQTRLLRIVGTFKFGISLIDDMRSYASISTVQKILEKKPDYITDIAIKLIDLNQAPAYADRYRARFGYKTEDWETANEPILVSSKIRNVLTVVVSATLLIVAGFGIYNIMNMTVVDKMKDIAILKAQGFEADTIVLIFLLQAVFIGILGGFVGLILGFFLSYALSKTPFNGGGFLSIDTFPVNFDPKFYVFGLLFGIITTILAGYFPSRRAAKIDPVEILRG